jgi:hypothetical protein
MLLQQEYGNGNNRITSNSRQTSNNREANNSRKTTVGTPKTAGTSKNIGTPVAEETLSVVEKAGHSRDTRDETTAVWIQNTSTAGSTV